MTINEAKQALDLLLDDHAAMRTLIASLNVELADTKQANRSLLDAVHGFRGLVEEQKLQIRNLQQHLSGRPA